MNTTQIAFADEGDATGQCITWVSKRAAADGSGGGLGSFAADGNGGGLGSSADDGSGGGLGLGFAAPFFATPPEHTGWTLS